jgi:NDP-sugar pyrophosphorylase family protein
VASGKEVRAWRTDAYWVDLGRREDYERAVTEFDQMHDRLLPPEPLAVRGSRQGLRVEAAAS